MLQLQPASARPSLPGKLRHGRGGLGGTGGTGAELLRAVGAPGPGWGGSTGGTRGERHTGGQPRAHGGRTRRPPPLRRGLGRVTSAPHARDVVASPG